MAIKYEAYATFKSGDDLGVLASIKVSSFEVIGGANRSIDLISTTDMSISSEMEQARSYKNILFYKLPSKDFADFSLMNIFRAKQSFKLYFIIDAYAGKSKTQSLWLISENATISSYPMQIGYSPKLLMVPVAMPSAKLEYDYSKNGKDFDFIEW